MLFGRYVNRFYLRYIHLFILGIIALLFVDYYQLEIPEVVRDITNGLKDGTLTISTLNDLVKILLIVLVVMFVGRFLWRVTLFGVGVKIENNLRASMFDHQLKLSEQYYQDHKTGALMALYTNDLMTIRQAFGVGTVMLVDVLFLGTLALYKMFNINVLLTIFSTIPMLCLALCGGIIGKYMKMKFEARQKSYEDLSDFVQENFSGISVIKAFVKETIELREFKKKSQNYMDKNIAFVKFATLLEVLISLFISSIMLVIIGYGSYLVYHSKMDIGTLTEFFSYFMSLVWPMMAIGQLINMRSQANASLKRINELLDEKIDITDKNVITKELDGSIRFNNFSFKYPDSNRYVLKDINLEIKPGMMVGIIGRTGSGKTTLVKSLLRYYNYEDNQLLIDDTDIMKLPFKDVRNLIGYVPQNNFLFSDTIKNNIGFAFNEVSIDDVKNAAIFADVDNNIMDFTDQYETILGEKGVSISGGQKQRLSIARAYLKDPKILIMDDSVSAVDTITEERIIKNLREYRKNKTTIIVAHRISTIKDLDLIVLIDDGKIVKSGTHEQMLENDLYNEMVMLQKLEEEVTSNEG